MPGGHNMTNFSGLYQALYLSNRRDEAAQAFTDLFALGVSNSNPGIRFLFASNMTEFANSSDMSPQYNLWLRQIAKYLTANPQCMTVVGNSSKAGTPAHNRDLSNQRADRIKSNLASYAPGIGSRLNAAGVGADDCKICSTPDSEENAFDRRVEFRVRSCQ